MISTVFHHEAPRVGVDAIHTLVGDADEDFEVDVVVAGGNPFRARVTPTPMPQGGRRWWWICPDCGRRRGHLYLAGRVACRECLGIGYACRYYSR